MCIHTHMQSQKKHGRKKNTGKDTVRIIQWECNENTLRKCNIHLTGVPEK